MKTTLFLLMSLDGKISTGAIDERDFDKDLPNIPGAAEGLHQYYNLEKQTDWYSFITGKVLAKIGWNEPKDKTERIPARLVVVDNQPHLTEMGIKNLLNKFELVNIATTYSKHPALNINDPNLHVHQFDGSVDFKVLFSKLEQQGAKSITIQSGGDMNALLLRSGFIDELSIVVAPVLVGGKDTPSLIGGASLTRKDELHNIKSLELTEVNKLDHNYLHVRYKVNHRQ